MSEETLLKVTSSGKKSGRGMRRRGRGRGWRSGRREIEGERIFLRKVLHECSLNLVVLITYVGLRAIIVIIIIIITVIIKINTPIIIAVVTISRYLNNTNIDKL